MALNQNRPDITFDPKSDLEFLEKELEDKNRPPVVDELSKFIDRVWTENQKNFKTVRQEMIRSLKRVKGEYEQNKLNDIQSFNGSEAYIRSAESKARAAESWIKDLYRAEAEMPWSVEPTAVADLPDDTKAKIKKETEEQALRFEQEMIAAGLQIDPVKVADLLNEYYEEKLNEAKDQVQKDAKDRCERAAQLIKDQNQESGWDLAFKDFVYYFTRLKFGIIKGPILTKKKKQNWVATPDGQYVLETKDILVNDVYAPSPFSIFPEQGIKTVNDGNIIEVHELSRQTIAGLKGVPGYNDREISAVLFEIDSGKLKKNWFTIDDETEVKRATKEKTIYHTKPETESAFTGISNKVKAMEFYGTVSGRILQGWGMEENLEPDQEYQVNCWKIGKHVIKAVINPDSLGRKPYHCSSWAKNPESLIGEGLIEFAGDIEDAMNAIIRALINNAAIASGPMAEVDSDRVDTAIPIYPWRQIPSTSIQMKDSGPAVNYYQPQMHTQELIAAWQFFSKILDEMTVPAYAQGASQSGVTAGTATVFTQLLAAASRSIKAVAANIDDDVISPYIQMCYDYNMKFSPDNTIKGDARIVAKGVSGLAAKEQQAQRKVEYLQVLANPTYQEILGAKNIASVLAQIAKSNDIDLPDMGRLDGDPSVEDRVSAMLDAQAGVDPMQENGQMATGGGAPKKPQGTNPDGSKAGVNNG